MKFLITGASGQLGQEWEKFLTERGATFTAYSSSRLDITNPRQIKEIMKADQPDIVLNCAACTDVDGAEREKERAFEVNSKGVSLLAPVCRHAAASNETPLLFTSKALSFSLSAPSTSVQAAQFRTISGPM